MNTPALGKTAAIKSRLHLRDHARGVHDRSALATTVRDTRRPWSVAITMASSLLIVATLLAPPAAADTYGFERQSSHAVEIDNPGPTPGRVVRAGGMRLHADLHADSGVAAADIYLDDRKLDSTLSGSSETTNRRLSASAAVGPGSHRVDVYARPGNGGSTVHRVWRFAASGMPVPRLAGSGRVETAVAISRHSYPEPNSATAGVVARATDFADALSGAPLAASVDGPLLLSATRGLSRAAGGELERALPDGATVYLLGGEGALAPKVARDLEARGFEPVRLAGNGRAATARHIGARLPASRAVMVVSGHSFPDALSASAPAARNGLPILLTGRDHLSQPTRAFLKKRDVDRAYLVGGNAVVDDAVARAIDDHVGHVVRLAGGTRYQTSVRVADYFFSTAEAVSLSNGTRFPDALAGGPHAAANGAPLLLTPPDRLSPTATRYVQAKQPSRAFLYGGTGVISDRVGTDTRRAAIDHGGPVEDELAPEPGAVINSLDTLQVTFRDKVNTRRSSVHVEVDGREVHGNVTQGDFENTLVFQAGDLPFDPEPYTNYPVEVVVAARDGDGVRHLEYEVVLRKLELSRGDSSRRVKAIQKRLTDLGYWLGSVDGNYGTLTTQAVTAFQKVQGLRRTGSVNDRTLDVLETAGRPQPRNQRSGRYVEIDKGRQVMLFVTDGRVEWAMNTSTGTGEYYYHEGERNLADTPEGSFEFTRQIDGMRNAPLGRMWRPKYFTSAGHAIHGSTNVPAHPASHGCARLTYPAIDFVWDAGLAPLGAPIFVY